MKKRKEFKDDRPNWFERLYAVGGPTALTMAALDYEEAALIGVAGLITILVAEVIENMVFPE